MEEDNFQGSANQYRGVNGDHPFEMRFRDANGPMGQHALLVLVRNSQFDEAEYSHCGQQREIKVDTQAHCSRRNSALKPGPKAAASA